MKKQKGGDTRAKAAAHGKKVGRPAKVKIVTSGTTRSVAQDVLGMDGPPDHQRDCPCRVCEKHPRNCTCFEQCGDCHKLKANCECEEYRPIKIRCRACDTIEDHRICQCEVCRWWRHRLSTDRRIQYDADVYLTNRRDGKPAESIIAEGKLEIIVREEGAGDHSATEAGLPEKVM
jgi:hypothetical protein